VSKTNAGSRPASRITGLEGKAFLDKLRAIPYVASWCQSGSNAPAYYGIGTGLKAYLDDDKAGSGTQNEKIQLLRYMYDKIPAFKNLIDRAGEALSKADMGIAERYAEKLNGETARIFTDLIKPEFEKSRTMIDLVKGENTENSPVSTTPRRTFAHMAQIELLRQAGEPATDEEKKALDAGIAMSMQALANAIGRFG
jgi:phosphoenolpyruvate carboxylase